MEELETAGHWKLVKEKKAPYRDDMPTESTAFVYKVLPGVPETFHARFPVSVKSCGRQLAKAPRRTREKT